MKLDEPRFLVARLSATSSRRQFFGEHIAENTVGVWWEPAKVRPQSSSSRSVGRNLGFRWRSCRQKNELDQTCFDFCPNRTDFGRNMRDSNASANFPTSVNQRPNTPLGTRRSSQTQAGHRSAIAGIGTSLCFLPRTCRPAYDTTGCWAQWAHPCCMALAHGRHRAGCSARYAWWPGCISGQIRSG